MAWPDYAVWQYTESDTVPGVNGHVDANRMKAALPDLQVK